MNWEARTNAPDFFGSERKRKRRGKQTYQEGQYHRQKQAGRDRESSYRKHVNHTVHISVVYSLSSSSSSPSLQINAGRVQHTCACIAIVSHQSLPLISIDIKTYQENVRIQNTLQKAVIPATARLARRLQYSAKN